MFALHIVLSIIIIILFVAVLGYFLARLASLLSSIAATLAKVSFGVRAVETQCAVIGPAADRVNENLAAAAAGLGQAAVLAERLGARR